ncbi:Uncharacterized protein PECH_006307 [Penicillium ucsense]|uniref:Mediator of RNA polymerase II transcription subunit 22 n=1 Tax=Penicillium ucsense TaxID=2839758 RepID=A0A8J8WMZ7_9EURO|nr:Uncharacterized protein PECM_000350 [Penicillium ucsense]KAF7739103.1 Uncharacterized protein PECH_006307 [Penicillium ucsense]
MDNQSSFLPAQARFRQTDSTEPEFNPPAEDIDAFAAELARRLSRLEPISAESSYFEDDSSDDEEEITDEELPTDKSATNEETPTEMAPQTTVKQLHERLDHNVSQLVQRFENILALAAAENTSHTATAVEENQMEVESSALVRSAEDLLAMSRTVKEMWFFGNLDTLGEDDHDRERNEKLEESVRAVEKAVDEGVLSKLVPKEKKK